MRIIDGRRYISVKEYAELKGINISRVSQLKKTGELPFVEFKDLGISLIDFELLELTNQDKRFAITKFHVPMELNTISVLDTGRYFMKTLCDLLDNNTSEEIVIKDEEISELKKREILLINDITKKDLQIKILESKNSSALLENNSLKKSNEVLMEALEKTALSLKLKKRGDKNE